MHRAVLGKGPPHFRKWFLPSTKQGHGVSTRLQENLHNKQLHDWLKTRDTELLRRTALGLVRVYNDLPQEAVDLKITKDFLKWLQNELKTVVRLKADFSLPYLTAVRLERGGGVLE